MGYRTILVDLTADGPVEARLDVARSLAARFEAALVGVHVMPEPLVSLPIWEGGGGVYHLPEVMEAERTRARSACRGGLQPHPEGSAPASSRKGR